MSQIQVLAAQIHSVNPHPNADRLEIATIGMYTTVVAKGEFQVGDLVAFFPPDILIPEKLATQLGVVNYLKAAVYPGDAVKSKCRVSATRLRGMPSFGFAIKLREDYPVGTDLSDRFHAVKYEAPEPIWFLMGGDNQCANQFFHVYTDIENYRNSRFAGAFEEGMPVCITEKQHGTNSRLALIDGEYLCGSHQCNKKEFDAAGKHSLYWKPLTENTKALLQHIATIKNSNKVIIFGEICGSKIQFMDYGFFGSDGYFVFDISVNGQYLNWHEVENLCRKFNVPIVSTLYSGPFDSKIVDYLVDGPTTICPPEQIRSSFKGREGIVIKPLIEQYSDILGGRLIMKVISVDYLQCRKTDSH